MGYNTSVIVLNDALHLIEKDVGFGQKIAAAARKVGSYPGKTVDISSGFHFNAASVIETHHADMVKVIAFGGNNAQDLGYAGFWNSSKEEILKQLANEMGYRIVKKRAK